MCGGSRVDANEGQDTIATVLMRERVVPARSVTAQETWTRWGGTDDSENGADRCGQGQKEKRQVQGSTQASMLNYMMDANALDQARDRAGEGKDLHLEVPRSCSLLWSLSLGLGSSACVRV